MIVAGLDVGKRRDPPAIAALQSGALRPGSHRPVWTALELANLPLGLPYQQLANHYAHVVGELVDAGHPVVAVIDATGIGAAVDELVRAARPDLHVVAVTIGAGRVLNLADPDSYVVGKHRLTEVLQVALEQRGLVVPDDVPDAAAFRGQCEQFSRKRGASGYESHEAATGHDDLVLAVELALWVGDTMHDQAAGVSPD